MEIEAAEVSCETIEGKIWNDELGTLKTCQMKKETAIDRPGTRISMKDLTVLGINFRSNKKINFLPIEIGDSFSHLVGYFAYNCSITRIVKINFKGLSELKLLSLSFNQIKKISSDTFDDLTDLEVLFLRE